jgi:hypothetical protein
MQRRRVFALLGCAAIGGVNVSHADRSPSQAQSRRYHMAWVAEVLKRMEMIHPGMTRETLLTVFTTEGGLWTGLQRTYVSQDCPYFKVGVEFQAVGRPEQDEDGRVTSVEGKDDIILQISTPYLQFSVMD